MWWLFAVVGLSTAGLLVLGVLAVRVYLAVEELAGQVARSTQALTAATERLHQAAGRVGVQAGEIFRP
ncbi:hypothetical protein [Actinacidiphila acidipaludis]|uniref:Two-component sensor histidine kinase n=1 Tax=Actinacidiphila acidipaludis TaxID=2873382 RepID=A0ABS7QEZ5_9ACTN|nr:hypothetical protein [Streptomyces acidipaludis]MBY8880517.1 hypothetical protein [Streptomyces acidipaludis]